MASPSIARFDPHFTQNVIDAIGPKTTPRTKQVLSSLIRHVHDFAREVELTTEEWMLGVQFMNAVGQISDARRNEGQRISDVIGLESYENTPNPNILEAPIPWLTHTQARRRDCKQVDDRVGRCAHLVDDTRAFLEP